MLFNSFEFVYVFLPTVAIVYFLLGKHSADLAKVWLLGASLFFYSWWNISYLPLLLASISINYTLGRQAHPSYRITAFPGLTLPEGTQLEGQQSLDLRCCRNHVDF